MTTVSADIEELERFGKTMKDQIDKVEQLTKEVDGSLGSLVWTGPARDRFQGEWDTNFKSALGKLSSALAEAGADCQARAQGTRQVLGLG